MGIGVLVGGGGAVGGGGGLVGGTFVAVGGTGVSVGGAGVSVGGAGVSVGARVSVGFGVLVGGGVSVGMGVAVGGIVLVGEGTGVNVGLGVLVGGTGMAVGACATNPGTPHPKPSIPKIVSNINICRYFIKSLPLLIFGSGSFEFRVVTRKNLPLISRIFTNRAYANYVAINRRARRKRGAF